MRNRSKYIIVFVSLTVALSLLSLHVTQALFYDVAGGHEVSAFNQAWSILFVAGP